MSRRSCYIHGTEPKRPKNLRKYDMIACGAPIKNDASNKQIYCEKPMTLMRRRDTMIDIPKKISCTAFGGHQIWSGYMWVAICNNKHQHLNNQPHVICSTCIENYSKETRSTPNFAIIRNAYIYKPKKRRST